MKAQGTTQMNLEPPRKAPDQVIGEKELTEVARHCDISGRDVPRRGHQPGAASPLGHLRGAGGPDRLFSRPHPAGLRGPLPGHRHTVLCGMDPEKLFAKYLAQGVLRYVHFKDIDPDPAAHPEYPPRRFRALGQGTGTFPACCGCCAPAAMTTSSGGAGLQPGE